MMYKKGAFVVSKNEVKSAIGQEFGQESGENWNIMTFEVAKFHHGVKVTNLL